MSDLVPIAVQLYSAREQLAQDFVGTMRRIADMGYVAVEPYGGMHESPQEAASLFCELGLEVCSSHIPFPDESQRDGILAAAEAYGIQRVCIAYLPPEQFSTVEAIKRSCEQLNRAGEFARANGLQLGYHNHWWEFKQLDGRSTVDLILGELEGDIFLQIDTYWVQVGGLDAAGIVQQIGARAPLLHLKDGPLTPEGDMTALGQGNIDIPGIVAASANTAEWHIVELDRCATDMLQALEDSYRYLTGAGLARGRI